jgi:hypothetical protein
MDFLMRGLGIVGTALLLGLTVPAWAADSIQMLPPKSDGDPDNVCPMGDSRILAWDGKNALKCVEGMKLEYQRPTAGPLAGQTFTHLLALNGGLVSRRNSDEGPFLKLTNTDKADQDGIAQDWVIWNMTGAYGNSLQFWSYDRKGCAPGGLCVSRLTITDSGNVGIGTASPHSKLDVNGLIQGNSIKVGNSGSCRSSDDGGTLIYSNGLHVCDGINWVRLTYRPCVSVSKSHGAVWSEACPSGQTGAGPTYQCWDGKVNTAAASTCTTPPSPSPAGCSNYFPKDHGEISALLEAKYDANGDGIKENWNFTCYAKTIGCDPYIRLYAVKDNGTGGRDTGYLQGTSLGGSDVDRCEVGPGGVTTTWKNEGKHKSTAW